MFILVDSYKSFSHVYACTHTCTRMRTFMRNNTSRTHACAHVRTHTSVRTHKQTDALSYTRMHHRQNWARQLTNQSREIQWTTLQTPTCSDVDRWNFLFFQNLPVNPSLFYSSRTYLFLSFSFYFLPSYSISCFIGCI